ncbi:MAG: Na+/H+ antiporter NhaC family protein, partial [Thermoanaerobaculia bacterium]|nr:Na+/H+ antiporter NhaC family protein [Thermoanaerobaculia bacterium]
MTARRPESRRSLLVSALPFLVLLAAFAAGTRLGLGAEGLLVSLIAAAAVGVAVAAARGASWSDVQREMGRKLAEALPVILILLSIGMLIGSWMLAGTIPQLVAYGIRLVEPRLFVLTAFLVTAVMSLATGTSWGSAGTLGVALMGAAAATGAPLAATGGAILSGAYLGDKMSPLSDTTNICAIAAGADLYAHIRHMLWTATPSAVLCLIIYTLAPAAPAAGVAGP